MQIERLIRQNKHGSFAVVISRFTGRYGPTGNPQTRTLYMGGLVTIEEARALRAELEALSPPRRPGRKSKLANS